MKWIKRLSIVAIIIAAGVLVFFHLQEGKAFERQSAMTIEGDLETSGCVGLNYHRVRDLSVIDRGIGWITRSDEITKYSVSVQSFEQQMNYLKEHNANFVTSEQVLEYQKEGEFPDKCVWVSFDDIDQSVYNNAFPILKEQNIPFTLYLIAGQIGQGEYKHMTMANWTQVREMHQSGLATLGSHTYNMHDLKENGQTPIFFGENNHEDLQKDLQRSIAKIEEQTGVTPETFAIPFGDTTDALNQQIQDAGFDMNGILAPRTIRSDDYPYYMNRIVINQPLFDQHIKPWVNNQEP